MKLLKVHFILKVMKIKNITLLIPFFSLYWHIGTKGTAIADTPPLTIWVHGTKLTPTIAFANFFYKMPGMNPAIAYDQKYHKRTIANLLSELDPKRYLLENFYFFGWNGKLCFDEREKASKDLYYALLQLAADYEALHQKKPTFRIITHSHGGNVVLNLAKVQDPEYPLIIDELILLCCPVQEETKYYIANDCFKRVYAFYSSRDMFQVIDPQGLYKNSRAKKTFSERRFDDHDKLRQARIQMKGKSLMHIDFLCTPFLQHLPNLCNEIESFYDSVIADQKNYEKIIDIKINKDKTVQFQKKLKKT